MIKSTLKIARYCPLVIQGFSNILGLFLAIMANRMVCLNEYSCWYPWTQSYLTFFVFVWGSTVVTTVKAINLGTPTLEPLEQIFQFREVITDVIFRKKRVDYVYVRLD